MRILFVGDLRPAYNYGAIATTEALLDLIMQINDKNEVRCIDRRSFWGTTPIEGWPEYRYPEKNNKVAMCKNALRKSSFLKAIKKGVAKNNNLKQRGNAPAKYEEYSAFAERIKNNEIWQYEKKLIEWADVIIVNSEGNIVHGTDANGYYRFGGRYVLFFEYLSKITFEKPTYVINHTVDPQNRDIANIIAKMYPILDGVYVREKKSIAMLSTYGVDNAKYVPDALWSHDFSNDKLVRKPAILKNFDCEQSYVCIGDSSGISNSYSTVKWDVFDVYSRIITEIKEKITPNVVFVDGFAGKNESINKVIKKNKIPSVSLNNCNYHELYYVLSKSKLFISGRWHASIISLLGQTPVLLWGSDSHKTEALYNEINYPYTFFDVQTLPINVEQLIQEAAKIISDEHAEQWGIVDSLKILAMNNVDMIH